MNALNGEDEGMTMTTETTTTTTNGNTWNEAARVSEQKALEDAHPPRLYTEEIRVTLSQDEIAARIADLTAERIKLAELEAKKKVAAKAHKNQVELCEGIVSTICAGTEERQVELKEEFVWDVGQVRVTRVDNGSLVSERAISAEERQLPLLGKSPNGELFETATGEYVDGEDEDDTDSDDGDDAEEDS